MSIILYYLLILAPLPLLYLVLVKSNSIILLLLSVFGYIVYRLYLDYLRLGKKISFWELVKTPFHEIKYFRSLFIKK